ncbi:alpha/beta-hydrolase [Schizophyllum commune Loenen D]|nr:alpha/beta-hydrolase [Schizophyllum commune Loenen D]
MSSPSPFKIAVPEEKLALIRTKLELVTWPDELEGAGSDYGAPLALVKRLVKRWINGHDWRAQEAAINADLPQFTIDLEVDGHGPLSVHFVHQRSEVGSAIPLLFVHGWPGSFLEARKIIPLLTAASEKHPSFHVVAVSLPGYGFSETPKNEGLRLPEYAEVCHQLTGTLGNTQYVTQGGGWCMSVIRVPASKYGLSCVKAWHTNFPLYVLIAVAFKSTHLNNHSGHPDPEHPIESCTPEGRRRGRRQANFERRKWALPRRLRCFILQSTKPQTIAYALTDSPVGLLAWIAEKLLSWSDEYPWTDDEILTWRPGLGLMFDLVEKEPTIPLGLSFFPRDWTRQMGNVVFEADHDKGGHFAAYEVPEALVDDLRRMFGKGGATYGVVDGLDGYDKGAA